MYKPIVDYLYKGEPRIVTGISSNSLRFEPGQSITVFVMINDESNIKARLDDSSYFLMGFIFALLGFIAVAIYAHESESWSAAKIALGVSFAASILLPKILGGSVTSGEDDQTINPNAHLITSKEEYINEASQGKLAGLIIAGVFLLVGLGLLYLGFNVLPTGEASFIFSSFENFLDYLNSNDIQSSKMKPILILGSGLLFILVAIYSLIFQWRKNKSLTKI